MEQFGLSAIDEDRPTLLLNDLPVTITYQHTIPELRAKYKFIVHLMKYQRLEEYHVDLLVRKNVYEKNSAAVSAPEKQVFFFASTSRDPSIIYICTNIIKKSIKLLPTPQQPQNRLPNFYLYFTGPLL